MIYVFSLYRRLKTPTGVITSSLWVDRECDCPFRERRKLCEEYPNPWAVGGEPKSTVDFEYDAFIDPKLGEPFGYVKKEDDDDQN